MYGFYCIAFIEYIFAGKALFDYINLLSPNNYKQNGRIIYISNLKTNMTKQDTILQFGRKKMDETNIGRNKT